jgi:hypothetical protein
VSTYTQRISRARKNYACDYRMSYSCHGIAAGQLYVTSTEFPGGEAMYANAAGHPVRMRICSTCEIERCGGNSACGASIHVHGCYGDTFGDCDQPSDHAK